MKTSWTLSTPSGVAGSSSILDVATTRCSWSALLSSGLDSNLFGAADDEKWDAPIVEAMEVAYSFGGPKTQTPTIVVSGRSTLRVQGPGDGAGPDWRSRSSTLGCRPGGVPGTRILRDHSASHKPAASAHSQQACLGPLGIISPSGHRPCIPPLSVA